ncbi:MAG: hypothetical protein IIC63_09240 [Proteobacteria bacterium]|nr:hypothetical protein [Pseudomonadota bacterium]
MNTSASAVVPGMVIQPSKLLPSLFRSLDTGRRLTILDVGGALPETVEFFSRFKCRIHFIDLFCEPVVRELQQNSNYKELHHQFEKLLKLPDGTRLDICLLWDFLCYLDDPALRAFNNVLRPYLYYGTRAHGFVVHHLAIRLENKQYGVMQEDAMSVRLRQTKQLATHPHSQIEMHEMLSCFDFDRGLLLPDGKLELLLKARDDILEF